MGVGKGIGFFLCR